MLQGISKITLSEMEAGKMPLACEAINVQNFSSPVLEHTSVVWDLRLEKDVDIDELKGFSG